MSASVVQVVHGTSGSGTSTCTANITVTAGNAIGVFAICDGVAISVSSCSDNVNGSYGAAKGHITDSSDFDGASFAKNNIAAGATTVSVVLSANPANGCDIFVFEISGVSATAYDTHAELDDNNANTGTDGETTGNCSTLAFANAIAIAFGMDLQGGSFPNAGTGWTSQGSGNGTVGFSAYRLQSKNVTSVSAFASTTTATAGGVSYFSMMMVFSEPAASGRFFRPKSTVSVYGIDPGDGDFPSELILKRWF